MSVIRVMSEQLPWGTPIWGDQFQFNGSTVHTRVLLLKDGTRKEKVWTAPDKEPKRWTKIH